MELKNNEFVAREPDFRGNGVSVWVAETEDGNNYLRVKVLNMNMKSIPCFKIVKKEVEPAKA